MDFTSSKRFENRFLENFSTLVQEKQTPPSLSAIATKRLPGGLADSTFGHLVPREISRVTPFVLLRGGVVRDNEHGRSPLVRGGIGNS